MNRPGIPKTDYSQVAKYYDRVRPEPWHILVQKVFEYGEIDDNCAVLDVGCGTGRFSLRMSDLRKLRLFALDPSVEMLREAAAKDEAKNISWAQGDGQQLPFRDNVFDCEYMTLVIHHIEHKEMALREIHRTLRRDGRCVVLTTSHSRIRKHVVNDFPGVTAIDLKRFPSIPSLKRTLTRIGFRNVRYHRVQHSEEVSTDEYLKRVRNKYISTLTLLSEDAFQRGFRIFEQKLRRKYGSRFRRVQGFVFVVGKK